MDIYIIHWWTTGLPNAKRTKREWARSEKPVVSPEWYGLVKQMKTFASRATWSSAKNPFVYMMKNNVAKCV